MVRLRTGENNLPIDNDILLLLNAGLEQVEARLGGIQLFRSYQTLPGQNVILLDPDIQDIISASWSNTDPTTPGCMVYNLQPMPQQKFMDVAGGFPATGAGPPLEYFLFQDSASGPAGPLPEPPAPILSSQSGASPGGTVYVVLTYVNGQGETDPGPANSIYLTPSLAALVGSPPGNSNDPTLQGYNVYATENPQGPFYLQNGSVIPINTPFTLPSTLLTVTEAPTQNTALGYASGGQMKMQLYPPPMLGQVNIYYRARPQLWADTSPTSWTNLDTMCQEAIIVWGCIRVLQNRGRGDEGLQLFKPEFDDVMGLMDEQIRRRTQQRSGQVRDVRGYSWNNFPGYWRM